MSKLSLTNNQTDIAFSIKSMLNKLFQKGNTYCIPNENPISSLESNPNRKVLRAKRLPKKSARFIKSNQENDFGDVFIFSNDKISINIIKVSDKEQSSKRVRGYNYINI